MAHPVMFRDGDPGLAELRRVALGFPEAFEKISHGRPVFCAPKMFAVYGGASKATGTMVRYPHALLVKVDESERRALEQDRRFFSPMYLGPSGWLGMDFDAAEVDWDEVHELIDASFRLIAPQRLIRSLDGP
ncbi:MmcQ/YjbR family DNA-binding protein [Mycolicibacter arupensis]|uniref:MmcQ/YjbR family DNA-binding protein n=1 Tax=Mycolicibacter arupensis TaxID=342002 RepID=A0A0F5N4S3_9MYCO|nr:MmcQ/YjbR family DNA-binding protein [Mycolicibacter arupensis]KAA1430294.1 MmcQ/YjbR family DNA-binding protein [Mycolicibacter arupensis]KKC01268.1 phosphoribosylglycinamide formyltransferase [Mycolicibacter arupensis]MCV7277362.1 MmcQ/YjbR family DNA-binding protein [Mycolicibacter arupensis]OQZ99833.1 phosphoribosylglycinamide formyltransferase [Mycolicibacter arupensis]TXI58753.1 MAG: MmcQ/YjbR family DNA-binding protein [Mycolicibacter arupensis]